MPVNKRWRCAGIIKFTGQQQYYGRHMSKRRYVITHLRRPGIVMRPVIDFGDRARSIFDVSSRDRFEKLTYPIPILLNKFSFDKIQFYFAHPLAVYF